VPVAAVSVSPSRGVPEIDGPGAPALGPTRSTWPLAALVALASPAALVAVTTTRMVAPVSAPVRS
jgi:hypothetical protein